MMVLGFARRGEYVGGRYVRRAVLEPRSLLPVSAACLVANGVRERLAEILATDVSLRLLEPRLPDPDAWHAIARDATCYRVRGPLADAAVVLRASDALAMAAAAFGESPPELREMSSIEARVLGGAVTALAAALAPVCGFREAPSLEHLARLHGFTTYFELLVERPVAARIGIALSREPVSSGSADIRTADLLDVPLELSVELGRGRLEAMEMLALRPGVVVPMMTKVGGLGSLKVAGTIVARGECGTIHGRYALIVRGGSEGS